MLIYRVQNLDNSGPYGIYEAWKSKPHEGPMHPGPYSDGMGENDTGDASFVPGMVFGFASLTQLRAWFDHKELVNLAALGFYVTIYDVTENTVVSGKTQVAFHMRHARHIQYCKISAKACNVLNKERVAA